MWLVPCVRHEQLTAAVADDGAGARDELAGGDLRARPGADLGGAARVPRNVSLRVDRGIRVGDVARLGEHTGLHVSHETRSACRLRQSITSLLTPTLSREPHFIHTVKVIS